MSKQTGQFDQFFSGRRKKPSLISIDPLGRPSVAAGSDRNFQTHMLSVCPSFYNFKSSSGNNIGIIVVLAEWIIYDPPVLSLKRSTCFQSKE